MHRSALRFATLAACSLLTLPTAAQPPILKDIVEQATGGEPRNDLEGGIWEYKVLERAGTRATVLTGKLRIKESAAFDVPGSAEGKLLDGAKEGTLDEGGSFPFGIKPPTPERLGILDRVAESNRGGDRIADVTYEQSRNSTTAAPKVTMNFDTDDKHPLSGEALVKFDVRKGGGVWRGVYYERTADGKKKRWNFELRFIED